MGLWMIDKRLRLLCTEMLWIFALAFLNRFSRQRYKVALYYVQFARCGLIASVEKFKMYYVIRLGSYRQKPLEKSQFEPNSEPTNDEIVSNHWNEQSWHSVKVFWGLKVYMLRAVKSSRKWCHHHAIFSGIWSWTTTARYNNLNLTLSSCDDVSASCIIKVLLSSNVIIMQTIIFALLRCHSVTAEKRSAHGKRSADNDFKQSHLKCRETVFRIE